MFCPKCGTPCTNGAKFCPGCGAVLASSGNGSYCPDCGHWNAGGVNFCEACGRQLSGSQAGTGGAAVSAPRKRTVAGCFTSPAALIALICYSAMILFGLVEVMRFPDTIQDAMRDAARTMTSDSTLYDLYHTLSRVYLVFLIFEIPGVLTLIGGWMTFASGLTGRDRGMSPQGMLLVKIGLILQAVVMFLLLTLLGTGSFLVGDTLKSILNTRSTVLEILIDMISFLLFAYLFLSMVFYRKLVRTAGVMHKTVLTGVPSTDVSAFAAIFALVVGGLNLLSLFQLEEALPIFSGLATAAAWISGGVFLLLYREQMRLLCAERKSRSAPSGEETFRLED